MLLSSSKKEREAYENYAGVARFCTGTYWKSQCTELCNMHHAADLYAIFKTTEKLERAYVRDAVTSKEYEPSCQKLIGQYKTLWETLRDTVLHSLTLFSYALWLPTEHFPNLAHLV